MNVLKKKLSVAVLTLGAMMGVSQGAFAEQKIRIAHGASPEFHMHTALLEFKKILEQDSNNRFVVEIFPSGQIGGDTNMVEAAQMGVVEIAVEPPSFLAKWDPAFEVAELPFIYPNKEVAFKVLESDAGDALQARLHDLGLEGLGWMEMGSRHITNNARPIHKPEDLQGIKLRTMKVPTHIEAFRALGANPSPMNFGEVYAGLQVGVIDGQENPLSHIYTQKFHEVQKYLSLTNHVLGLYLPVINQEFYEALSSEDQALIKESMRKAIEFDKNLIREEESKYLNQMAAQGIAINELSAEEMAVFQEAMKPLSTVMRDRVGGEIYDLWTQSIKDNSN